MKMVKVSQNLRNAWQNGYLPITLIVVGLIVLIAISPGAQAIASEITKNIH